MTEALNMLQVYLRQAGTVFKCVMVNKFYIIAYIDFLQLRTACKSVFPFLKVTSFKPEQL